MDHKSQTTNQIVRLDAPESYAGCSCSSCGGVTQARQVEDEGPDKAIHVTLYFLHVLRYLRAITMRQTQAHSRITC